MPSEFKRLAKASLPTRYGQFLVYAYAAQGDETEYLALVMGDISADEPILCRLHSSCVTGDLLGSLRCDCGDQLELALESIKKEAKGVLLYVEQEGRGIGLVNKIRAYELQDQGLDTVDANLALGFKADERDYEVAATILRELGLKKLRLMTNNPTKKAALEKFGLEITEVLPIIATSNTHNELYLQTKRSKMGHTF